MHPTDRPRRNAGFLLLAVVFLSLFSWFAITFPPVGFFHFLFFFLLVFGFCFTLLLYLFARIMPAVVFSCAVIVYLLLRLLHLTHPIYGIFLLIVSFAVLKTLPKKSTQKKE